MKLKISELKPNPFKEEINKGKLNKEIVKKIKGNIKELGLMGSLPVFKRDNEYFLVAGHHRLQALKETFGNDYQVEVTLHNYSDENVLRGMVIENLTQRSDELVEVTENLGAVRKWLKSNVQHLNETKTSIRGRENEGRPDEAGSIRNIYDWLSKNGEVISLGKISEYLKVYDNLDRNLLKQTVKIEGARNEEQKISIEEAKTLSRLEKSEQKLMQGRLEETGLDYKQKSKLVTSYLNSPKEVREQIKKGIVGLKDIDLAITQYNLRERKNKTIKVEDISKKINSFIDRLSFSIGDTENNLKGVIKDIAVISRYTQDMNERQKARLSMKINSFGELLSKVSKLMNEIKERI